MREFLEDNSKEGERLGFLFRDCRERLKLKPSYRLNKSKVNLFFYYLTGLTQLFFYSIFSRMDFVYLANDMVVFDIKGGLIKSSIFKKKKIRFKYKLNIIESIWVYNKLFLVNKKSGFLPNTYIVATVVSYFLCCSLEKKFSGVNFLITHEPNPTTAGVIVASALKKKPSLSFFLSDEYVDRLDEYSVFLGFCEEIYLPESFYKEDIKNQLPGNVLYYPPPVLPNKKTSPLFVLPAFYSFDQKAISERLEHIIDLINSSSGLREKSSGIYFKAHPNDKKCLRVLMRLSAAGLLRFTQDDVSTLNPEFCLTGNTTGAAIFAKSGVEVFYVSELKDVNFIDENFPSRYGFKSKSIMEIQFNSK